MTDPIYRLADDDVTDRRGFALTAEDRHYPWRVAGLLDVDGADRGFASRRAAVEAAVEAGMAEPGELDE